MRILLIATCVFLLAACASNNAQDAGSQTAAAEIGSASSGGSWWWPFGDGEATSITAGGIELGVNAYLWRATLDTLNFMPLSSVDPIGGVIITDWYSTPENPTEQMKVTAYVTDRRPRADALRVSVFRQVQSPNGWVDAVVNPDTSLRLENAVLTRARELYISNVQ